MNTKNLLSSLFLLMYAFSFYSCTKTEKDVFVEPYIINGIKDVTFKKGIGGSGYANMPLSIQYNNGKQEYLTLSLENSPTGLVHMFSMPSGYVPFYTDITLVDSGIAPGNYVLKLKSKGENTLEKTYNINLKVEPGVECQDAMSGSFYINNSCFGSGGNQLIYRKTPTSNMVVFPDFLGGTSSIEATVNCGNGSLSFASQTFAIGSNQYTLNYGSGYYNYNPTTKTVVSVSMNLNIAYSSGGSFTCYVTLYR
jgi:hypothetical protein